MKEYLDINKDSKVAISKIYSQASEHVFESYRDDLMIAKNMNFLSKFGRGLCFGFD
jgi:hypothetical protein